MHNQKIFPHVRFGVTLCLLLILWGCDSFQSINWQELVDEDYGFAVEFPGKVKIFGNFSNLGGGQTLNHQNFLLNRGDVSYRIIVSSHSHAAFNNNKLWDAEKGFAAIRNNLINQSEGGTVAKEETLDLDNHEGRELEINSDKKGTLYLRMYYLDGKIYGISVSAPKGKDVMEDKNRFFNSFRFI